MLRRFRPRARPILGLATLGAASLLSLASANPEGGDRAMNGCPAGETCSPDTPNGLYFKGAYLSDDGRFTEGGPRRIARGGIQTISAFLDAEGNQPFASYEALAGGTHISILDHKDNAVRVLGVSPVGDFLRLVDPDTKELYDRKMLEVGDVATLKIVPRELDLTGDKELYDADLPDVVWKSSHADSSFTIALLDATGVRLVDETLDVQTGAGFSRTSDFWDGLHQTAAVAPGTYAFNVKLGSGDTRQVSLTTVDKADGIVWTQGTQNDAFGRPEDGLPGGASRRYCFRATNAGVPVMGESFAYEVEGNLSIEQSTGSCVVVTAASPGSGRLTVRVDDVSLDFAVPVKTSKRSGGEDGPLEGTPLPAITDAPAAGDRAAAAAALR
jgi:hypothetical protein